MLSLESFKNLIDCEASYKEVDKLSEQANRILSNRSKQTRAKS